MRDTISDLQIKRPLSVKDVGLVFWSPSYSTCRIPQGVDCGDFFALAGLPWELHYSTPKPSYSANSWSFALEIDLLDALKPTGRECAQVHVDYLMGEVDTSCNNAKSHDIPLDTLSLCKLFSALKKLAIELGCEDALFLYDPAESDGNQKVLVEFDYCRRVPTPDPDMLLPLLVQRVEALHQTA